jgi:RimJ/RimL family protein N-acetyltransferase
MKVELATEEDIPAIMTIERSPGFDSLVGRWSAEEHAAEMAKPSARYFIMRDGDQTAGFVMIQRLGEGHDKVHLRRIAVADPGKGAGTRLINGVLDWLYTETAVNRIDLDVYIENERAKRSYEKAGFQVEGRLRDYHRNDDGTYRDMWLMSILRRDWAKRHRL